MIKRIIVIVSLFLSVSCAEEQSRVISDLEDKFAKEMEIGLEPEEYLSIRFLEVNERGDLLVTARRGKVLLFNGSGELIRDLGEHAGEEHPGLNWSPTRAIFLQDNSIFVQNNAPWGLYFDENGNLEKTAPSDFHVSNRFTAGADKHFYSMEINPGGSYIRKLTPEGDELGRFKDVPERFINLMQRYRVGNQFVADDRFLFFTMVAEPALFRLDLERDELNRYEDPPGYFNRAGEDISSLQQVGPERLAAEISDFTDNHTVNYSLHQVTDHLLLIQYQNRADVVDGKAGFGIQMVTIDGKFPMKTDLLTDEWVVAAGNGMIYTMKRTDEVYDSPVIYSYSLRDSFIENFGEE